MLSKFNNDNLIKRYPSNQDLSLISSETKYKIQV